METGKVVVPVTPAAVKVAVEKTTEVAVVVEAGRVKVEAI